MSSSVAVFVRTSGDKCTALQWNLNSSNTDGSFTMANSNSVLSPYEILPMDQENKYLRMLSYFIMKLESPLRGDSNEYNQHTIIV